MLHPKTRAPSGDSRAIDLRDEVGVLRSRLAIAEASFSGIVERSSDGILVVDRQGVVRFANAAALSLLGRSRSTVVGADIGFAVLVGNVAEVELVRPGGGVLFAEMRVVDTVWEGQPCLLALLRDVTDRHQVQAELARRATHDHLTGLPNRFLLEDHLALALDRLGRTRGSLALLMADLDDFKSINDQYGHVAGDAVLVEAAGRIRKVLRPVDTVARYGGDEFVLLCESTSQTAAAELSDRLKLAFCAPFVVAGEERTIGLSVGYVLTDEPGMSTEALLAAADEHMYGNKRRLLAAHEPLTTSTNPASRADEGDVVARTEYRFTLYVAGLTDRSLAASEDVDRLCEQYLPAGAYSVRVVDVLAAVDEADAAQVLVTPTLVRHEPPPVVRIVGALSDAALLAAAFGLGHSHG